MKKYISYSLSLLLIMSVIVTNTITRKYAFDEGLKKGLIKQKISKADKEKLGEHITDFARWALHQRIQSDVKLNKKAKQLKIELPNHLKVLLEDPIEFNLDEQKKQIDIIGEKPSRQNKMKNSK